VSRIPRAQEHLKAGFTAEAVSAARFRAYAFQAEQDGQPNLAEEWRRLAAAKDQLAVQQLAAAGQVLGGVGDVKSALAEERYENDVLYPKMMREVDGDTARVLGEVVEQQKEHLARLEELRRQVLAAARDVAARG
jgi:rubrerythrin